MKTLKKLLSSVLVVMMLMSIVVLPASAEVMPCTVFESSMSGLPATNTWYNSVESGEKWYEDPEMWGTFVSDSSGLSLTVYDGHDHLKPGLRERNYIGYALKDAAFKDGEDIKITLSFTPLASPDSQVKFTGYVDASRTANSRAYMFKYDTTSKILTLGSTETDALNLGTEYIITTDLKWNSQNSNYDIINSVAAADGTVVVENVNAGEYAYSVADINRIGFTTQYITSTGSGNAKTILVKNVKVQKFTNDPVLSFGDIKYYEAPVVLSQHMVDINDAELGVSTENGDAYESGQAWGMTTDWSAGHSTAKKDDMLWFTNHYGVSGLTSISKRFTPISDGEKLEITGTFRLASLPSNNDVGYRILLDDGTQGNAEKPANALSIFHNFKTWQGNHIRTLDTGAHISTWDTSGHNGTELSTGDVNDSTHPLYIGNDVTYTFTMEPDSSDSSKYLVTCKIGSFDTASKKIDKTLALAFNTIRFQSMGKGSTNTELLIGHKDVKITKPISNPPTALQNGINTLYVPVENITGHNVSYRVVAAVTEGTGENAKQVAYYISDSTASSNDAVLSVNVNITDANTQYVQLFVFDSLENIRPWTTPLTTALE